MQRLAYMLIGCPGVGKTWVAERCKDAFTYVHHDLFIGMAGTSYVVAILRASEGATAPLLIESPFSISQIKEPLERRGIEVIPIFIQETADTIKKRYYQREGKEIPKGHLTRQETYRQRYNEYGRKGFMGTSEECLKYLTNLMTPKNE